MLQIPVPPKFTMGELQSSQQSTQLRTLTSRAEMHTWYLLRVVFLLRALCNDVYRQDASAFSTYRNIWQLEKIILPLDLK